MNTATAMTLLLAGIGGIGGAIIAFRAAAPHERGRNTILGGIMGAVGLVAVFGVYTANQDSYLP